MATKADEIDVAKEKAATLHEESFPKNEGETVLKPSFDGLGLWESIKKF
jgi:hypothetical protein